jgi:hypothetical protein
MSAGRNDHNFIEPDAPQMIGQPSSATLNI